MEDEDHGCTRPAEDDDSLSGDPSESFEAVEVAKQFPNAMVLHGLKHVTDNILQSTLGNMTMFLGSIYVVGNVRLDQRVFRVTGVGIGVA